MTPVMTDIEHPYDADDGSTLNEGEWMGMRFGIAKRRHRDGIIAGMTETMREANPYDVDDGSMLTEGEWQGMGFGIAARRHRDEIIAGMMETMRRTDPEAGQSHQS